VPNPIQQNKDDALFTYRVASADMRYIEIGERRIVLRSVPGMGPIVLGEMEGCEPDCEINLGEILLEYALTCEGCRDEAAAGESAGLFGVRLGRLLAERLCRDSEPVESITFAFTCILNSMRVPYTSDRFEDRIRFSMAYNPLDQAAQEMGVSRGAATARRALAALCKTVLRITAPDWVLILPARQEAVSPAVLPVDSWTGEADTQPMLVIEMARTVGLNE